MKIRTNVLAALLTALTILLVRPTGAVPATVPGGNPSNTQVHMVVTVETLKEGDQVSAMKAEDVRVQQGRNSLRVTGWIPSRGEQAGLQLFILIQSILDNQYYLVFQAVPGRRADLQRVKLSTETPGVEIVSADNVWVPAFPQPATKK
jgi:hypothetical protein